MCRCPWPVEKKQEASTQHSDYSSKPRHLSTSPKQPIHNNLHLQSTTQTQWLPRRSSLFSPPTTRLTPLTDPLAGTWYVSIFLSSSLLLLSNPNFQLVTSSDLINTARVRPPLPCPLRQERRDHRRLSQGRRRPSRSRLHRAHQGGPHLRRLPQQQQVPVGEHPAPEAVRRPLWRLRRNLLPRRPRPHVRPRRRRRLHRPD